MISHGLSNLFSQDTSNKILSLWPLSRFFSPASVLEQNEIPEDANTKSIKKSIDTHVAGIEAKGWRSFVPNAKRTVAFSMGYGSKPAYYRAFTKVLNFFGCNVVLLELPKPDNGDTFSDGRPADHGYRDLIAGALLSKNSPFLEGIPDNNTVHLITHSTSGLAFELAARADEKFSQFASAFYSNVVHTAPMLDACGASKRYHPLRSKVYLKRCQKDGIRDELAGSLPTDQKVLKWRSFQEGIGRTKHAFNQDGIIGSFKKGRLKRIWQSVAHDVKNGIEIPEHFATHLVAGTLKQAGSNHVDEVEADIESGTLNSDSPYMQINRSFFLGKYDYATENKVTIDFANMLEAPFEFFEAGHCQISAAKDARARFLGIIGASLSDNPFKLPQRPQEQAQHMLPGSFDTPHEAHLQM